MEVAISDMELIKKITPSFLKAVKDVFTSQYLVLDPNIDEKTNAFIFENYQGKIFVDGISTSKVLKLKKYLPKIFLLKCNLLEAQTLVGKYYGEKLVTEIIKLGVKQIVISNGPKDIYYGSDNVIGKVKVEKMNKIVNTAGAGDAMISGIIFGIINNQSLEKAIEIGKKLSQLTLLSQEAVSSKIYPNFGLD